jgi:hypothetical protein
MAEIASTIRSSERCGARRQSNFPEQRFSWGRREAAWSMKKRRGTATKVPSNTSIVGQKKNRFVWEFCGNKGCFPLLSRDKSNRCPASSVSWISHLQNVPKISG